VPATSIGLGGAPMFTQTANGSATLGVPTAQDPLGMHIERDGDIRRLVVDGRTPEELCPNSRRSGRKMASSCRPTSLPRV